MQGNELRCGDRHYMGVKIEKELVQIGGEDLLEFKAGKRVRVGFRWLFNGSFETVFGWDKLFN